MKNLLLIPFFTFLLFLNITSQEQKSNYIDQVKTIDNTIETLYSVISGEKGVERNWELMQYLFHPEAKMIPSGYNKEGEFKAHYITPDQYIDQSGKWLIENGFFEKEIHRTVNTFGNISHVFSTYEAFNSEADKTPFMRGINSIQLLHDGERWWILNIYWSQESKTNLIPKEYLPIQ
jgi:hypothetical protein